MVNFLLPKNIIIFFLNPSEFPSTKVHAFVSKPATPTPSPPVSFPSKTKILNVYPVHSIVYGTCDGSNWPQLIYHPSLMLDTNLTQWIRILSKFSCIYQLRSAPLYVYFALHSVFTSGVNRFPHSVSILQQGWNLFSVDSRVRYLTITKHLPACHTKCPLCEAKINVVSTSNMHKINILQ